MKIVASLKTIIGLSVLAASVAFNVVLGKASLHYYWLLNETRLDPFGLLKVTEALSDPQATRRIVVIGDSRAAAWPPLPGIESTEFINRGISGQTTAQVLGRFQPHVADLEPDVVMVQAGINDVKAIPLFPARASDIIHQCKQNISEIAASSLQLGAKVVVIPVIPAGSSIPLARVPFWSRDVDQAVEACNEGIRHLASDRVVVFDPLPFITGANGRVYPHFQRDFLHLNSAGYEVLNRELKAALTALLQ